MHPSAPLLAAPIATMPWSVLHAPPRWHNIDFISDLHLQASEATTFCAWRDFMRNTRADAVFILGDLFEVWVGDDVVDRHTDGFENQCAQVLKSASQHLDIFFMHGNRDFLLGPSFAKRSCIDLLGDPCILEFSGQRWLLSHGDALCLADTDYQRFREEVRSDNWKKNFLGQPLKHRLQLARDLRSQSEAHKRTSNMSAEVDAPTSCFWLHKADAGTLIHGHTHMPADHHLGDGLRRLVLSDWDLSSTPPRAEVLRLSLTAAPGGESLATDHRLPATLG
jgi:UDP-2,3-diacylglucosamine hydrolase